MIVKICGLSTLEMIDAALAAGADMVGFVHFEKSPRHVALAVAKSLGAHVGGKALKVLVTVDMDDMALANAIAALQPHALQLHGHEQADRVASLKARFGLPVIKAIGIGDNPDDVDRVGLYDGIADMLLLDAAPADDRAELPGGNGARFDWGFLSALKVSTPWLLAGGLTPENVGEAVAKAGAYGVDVSSGVESGPGVKDAAKIAAFVASARAAAKSQAA
jgi:phosphoribosylanthranilate isomerase